MKRFYTLATAMAIGATAVMAQTMIVVDKSNNEYRFGVDRIAQMEAVTGVAAPARLAALKGKAPRFHQVTKREAMENVVLDFLK